MKWWVKSDMTRFVNIFSVIDISKWRSGEGRLEFFNNNISWKQILKKMHLLRNILRVGLFNKLFMHASLQIRMRKRLFNTWTLCNQLFRNTHIEKNCLHNWKIRYFSMKNHPSIKCSHPNINSSAVSIGLPMGLNGLKKFIIR